MVKPFIKYAIISAAIFGFMVALRFIPYTQPAAELEPLSPSAFDQLGNGGPSSMEEQGRTRSWLSGFLSRFNRASLSESPSSDAGEPVVRSSFPVGAFGRYEFPGSASSPSTELEDLNEDAKPLPTPITKPIVPAEPYPISQITVITPQEASKTIERIVERIIIREVPVYVPQPVSTPAAAPASKPVPVASQTVPVSTCSIQTFENSAGTSSHTLLFQCEGFGQCSIARNGESFLDITGKGYFNFPGTPPNNYKIRCDDLARVWSSAITPSASKPLYDQVGFRWFDNDNNEIGGAPLAGVNSLVTLAKTGFEPIRLRLAVLVGRAQAAKGDAKFKLQAAFTMPPTAASAANINSGVLCNQIPDAEFKDVNLLDKVIFMDNSDVSDKALMAPKMEDPFYGIAIPQTYQESNSISNANAAIPPNVPGIWDISLRMRNLRSKELACFRFSRGDGTTLDAYDVWPAIYNDK